LVEVESPEDHLLRLLIRVQNNEVLIDKGISKNNKEKSKTRARVEHLFGFVENGMNGSFIRTIGIARAKAKRGGMIILLIIFV
jgi:hypothetical protein